MEGAGLIKTTGNSNAVSVGAEPQSHSDQACLRLTKPLDIDTLSAPEEELFGVSGALSIEQGHRSACVSQQPAVLGPHKIRLFFALAQRTTRNCSYVANTSRLTSQVWLKVLIRLADSLPIHHTFHTPPFVLPNHKNTLIYPHSVAICFPFAEFSSHLQRSGPSELSLTVVAAAAAAAAASQLLLVSQLPPRIQTRSSLAIPSPPRRPSSVFNDYSFRVAAS